MDVPAPPATCLWNSYFSVPRSASLFYARLCICRGPVSMLRLQLTSRKMTVQFGLQDWRDRKLREWLLLLLRFSITRESRDRAGVLAIADELDSLSGGWRPTSPSFFLRTSNEVCDAICAPDEGYSTAQLRKHIARIDDPRLRRAFRAAVGLEQTSAQQEKIANSRQRPYATLARPL
jgi:hypothetical protein